jgi:uncharacterized protein YecE (DUF72 family)
MKSFWAVQAGIILILLTKGGWTGVFYPDNTKRLRYYSQFFNTAEMDSFYDRFYSQMTKGTFIGMSRATSEKFQF